MSLEHLVQSTLKNFGYRLTRHRESWEDAFRSGLVARKDIGAVVDVGAFTGFYAARWRHRGFTGPMLSIEPTQDSYRKLCENRPDDAQWIRRNLAIGDAPGELQMHITQNGQSSSLLKPLKSYNDLLPETQVTSTETVRIATLDSVVQDELSAAKPIYLKIDVQGLELKVLAGAQETLSRTEWIEIEVCVEPAYEGAPAAEEIVVALSSLGFGLDAVFHPYFGRKDDRVLQFDAIFVRRG